MEMDRSRPEKSKKKWTRGRIILLLLVTLYTYKLVEIQLFDEPAGHLLHAGLGGSGRSYGYAPLPAEHEEAIVQVYGARTRGAKKALAIHCWIATKRKGADHFVISQVIGWRLRPGGTAIFSEPGIPDRDWYGNAPRLLLDKRGPEAEALIGKIEEAVASYPWAGEYTVWPGPNSNTFVAWVGLQVPELGLDLPSTAIGKDWRPWKNSFGLSASGTGLQVSAYGLLGASIGYEEGIEVNVLGLSFEADVLDLALELPGAGRIGLSETDEIF